MQEEIAEKRRLAQERLRQSRLNHANQNNVMKHKIEKPPNENSAKRFCEALDQIKSAQNGASIKTKFGLPIKCKCEIVTETHFQFTFASYNEQLIQILKSMPTKLYDHKTKFWKFQLSDYDTLVKKIEQADLNVTVDRIPMSVIRICKEPKDPPVDSCLNSIEPKLLETLMPFQKDGVCFGIQKKGRCMIADEMGLGKTYQALALADFYRDDFPVIICTTATTRSTWHKKVIELLPYVPCQSVITLSSTKDYFRDAKIVITSYSLFEKVADSIFKMKFGVAIMDESHMLKNSKAKCTQVAQKLATITKRFILLTGTPALSRPLELFTQIQMLCKSAFSFKEFTKRYCEGYESNFGWDASGSDNLAELNVILSKKFMIRRTKNEVLSDFSDKVREIVELNVDLEHENPDNVQILTQIAKQLELSSHGTKDHNTFLLMYYSETAKIKTRAVCNYILDLLKNTVEKFIVFGHHVVMLNAISECLEKKAINHIRIDGTTRNDVRSKLIDYFQKNEGCRVAVLSMKACNTGITLTAAKMVVFAELDWNPSTLTQAESRAHRIGQVDNVKIKYLLAKNTADDIIWAKLLDKLQTLKEAGLSEENFRDTSVTSHRNGSEHLNMLSQWLEKNHNKPQDSTATVVYENSTHSCNKIAPPPAASTSKSSGSVCDDKDNLLKEHGISFSDLNELFKDSSDSTQESVKTIIYTDSGPSCDESKSSVNIRTSKMNNQVLLEDSNKTSDSQSLFDDADDEIFLNLNY